MTFSLTAIPFEILLSEDNRKSFLKKCCEDIMMGQSGQFSVISKLYSFISELLTKCITNYSKYIV